MKKLYDQFQKEKGEFEKEKEYLRFKKNIEKQRGITIQAIKSIKNEKIK